MRVALLMLCSLCFVLCVPAQQPDWKPVGAVLGEAGSVLPDGTFRIDVPRKEPVLRNEFGFVAPPAMVLTYAAFTGTPSERSWWATPACCPRRSTRCSTS